VPSPGPASGRDDSGLGPLTALAAGAPPAGQLPLPLRLPAAAGFEQFIATGNTEVLAAVRGWCRAEGPAGLFVHGAQASGKSLLLQAAAAELAAAGRPVVYVPLDHAGVSPDMLEDLEHLDAVLLDALETVAGRRDWEEPLFHLYNRLQACGNRLLAASRLPAGLLPFALADLRSRLSAAPAYALTPLDDDGRARLLRDGAAQRGLRLDEAVIAYVLKRCPRDPGWLRGFLERLDEATLAEKRRPTLPFVSRLLERDGTSDRPADLSQNRGSR